MIIGANVRFGSTNTGTNGTKIFSCQPNHASEASILFTIALLGIVANAAIMALIIGKANLRRWSQGLIFHQATIDCTRATMLLPLAFSLHFCRPIYQCSIFETIFLLLATVSAVNLLTTVLNNTPLMADDDGIDIDWLLNSPHTNSWLAHSAKDHSDSQLNLGAQLLDAPHCVLFGISMIWFAAITVNLGPTFITGALANNVESEPTNPSCPLIMTPYRHYIVNLLWVIVNSLCLVLTAAHLIRLHRDLMRPRNQAVRVVGMVSTILNSSDEQRKSANLQQLIERLEQEGIRRIRMFTLVCVTYCLFWGPLFLAIVFGASTNEEGRGLAATGPPKDPTSHQVMLYICFAHAFVNPTLFMLLHSGLKEAAIQVFCCSGPQDSPRRFANAAAAAAAARAVGKGVDYGSMMASRRSLPTPPSASPIQYLDAQSHMETVI